MVESTRGSVNYGATDNKGSSRFQVAGDARRMFPVFAAGGLFCPELLGQDIQSGSACAYFTGDSAGGSGSTPAITKTEVLGSQNMISNGKALFAFGAPEPTGSAIALRLGVTGTSGGNSVTLQDGYGQIVVPVPLLGAPGNAFLLWGGEAIYQNTNATGGTIGAAVEAFTVNVGGTVTVGAGSTSITGNVTTFTTASLTAAPYGAYHGSLPSKTLLRAGDLILITLDSGSKSLHRITAVSAATGAGALSVTPAVPSAATAKAYTLYRSGGGWPSAAVNSRVITLFDASGNPFCYYCGSQAPDLAPTLQAVKVGGPYSHFMAPQTTSGGANVADPKAIDIAYYKGFLLYGYGSSISWSVAGFPTSFTTGFGADDLPSGNITVVDPTGNFIGFEYLGEQLVALFDSGIWEIQATGNVPEFQFFQLPEPVGAYQKWIAPKYRNRRVMCSARNAVFYWSNSGVMMLTGGTAKTISSDIWSIIQNRFNAQVGPNLTWEPTSDTLFVMATEGDGWAYNIPTATWSYINPSAISGDTYVALTGDCHPFLSTVCSMMYDVTLEKLTWFDKTVGGPWSVDSSRFIGLNCVWATPIVNLGDNYASLGVLGLQFDGVLGTNNCSFNVYAGKTPYSMHSIQTGTVSTIDNRMLLGKKVDFQYVAVQFAMSAVSSTTGVLVKGANFYFEPGQF